MAQQEQGQRVIVIVGATSSGKSALAVEVARRIGGEVISADSRQVYRGLNIGTGKITKREKRSVRHHLLDVADPKKIFTAQDFLTRARNEISSIQQQNKIPIICGGTGFYIDALLGRVALANVPANQKLRSRFEKKTARQLFALLKKKDPRRAETIDPHNKRRLIRAIEIASARSRDRDPVKNTDVRHPYFHTALWIGLQPDAKTLRKKINARLKERLRRGMIAEARRLHARGLSYRRMHSLGLEYRSLARLLQKKISRAELEQELRRAIWQYARRQTTYWRRNKHIRWFEKSTTALFDEVRRYCAEGIG